ncbi:MAG: hypothetical protein FJX74_08035 [Armatimonadetes bacterium]|nr:hypothetical protein [Armatimonadota bacterium]
MKTERAMQMALFVGAIAAAWLIAAPRPAHAGDTGKILGVIAAGVILHEILDDDDDGRWVCRRHNWRPAYGRDCGRPGFFNTQPRCPQCRGYGWQPVPPGHRAPVCYEPARSGVRLDVYRGPRGKTSVGIEYRGRRR